VRRVFRRHVRAEIGSPAAYVGRVLIVESPTGLRYLSLVTALAQRRRSADSTGEVWEAADLQWWWPRDRHDDPADAQLWLEDGEPVAAAVITRLRGAPVGCDVFADADFAPAWQAAGGRCAELDAARLEMAIPEHDDRRRAAARSAGFVPTDDYYSVLWMTPADRRDPRRPLPAGYRIVARSEDGARPHPMIGRNGADVEDGLRLCSLYDADLDLAVLAPDGTVAGYGLFWPDGVTGVGLVEPMRVEAAHGGRGLGAHLMDAGLQRLIARGCTRLKISVEPANTPAVRLYTGAGFVSSGRDRTWVYGGAASR
jgi:GNAT superfamily N-acetyltransferase